MSGDVGQTKAPEVPNYLIPAVLTTVFCCIPFGILAIVYAAQVNTKLQVGDYAGALAASANAKKWTWISTIVGLLVLVALVAMAVILALMIGYTALEQQGGPNNMPVQGAPPG